MVNHLGICMTELYLSYDELYDGIVLLILRKSRFVIAFVNF